LEGEKDEAWCPKCNVRFSRGRVAGRIQIVEESGERWEVPSHELSAAVEGWDPLPSSAPTQGRGWSHRAQVEVRYASQEVPFRFKGELLGFAELFESSSAGVLEIDGEALTLWPEEEVGARELDSWLLMDLRAVQTSSKAVQFSHKDGTLVQFRFSEDSPRRWERLLREALRVRYREAGLGEIVEFQPRIVAEP